MVAQDKLNIIEPVETANDTPVSSQFKETIKTEAAVNSKSLHVDSRDVS